jgi:hypothetical protein
MYYMTIFNYILFPAAAFLDRLYAQCVRLYAQCVQLYNNNQKHLETISELLLLSAVIVITGTIVMVVFNTIYYVFSLL